jgi:hypothetical protein
MSEPEGERVSDLINFLDPLGIIEFEKNELKKMTKKNERTLFLHW